MIRSISITFVSIIIISFLIYFFNGLFNYQERILSLTEYSSKKASNIVILTGGSNRIKDGLKIIENFDNSAIKNIKLLISGTGKGFTTSNVNKLLPKNVYLNKFVKCCVKLDNKSENTYSNAIETFKWSKKTISKHSFLLPVTIICLEHF